MTRDHAADRGPAPGRDPGKWQAAFGNNLRRDVTTPEAAAALGISARSVRRAIAGGALAATKRGGAYRIDRDELARFAAGRSRLAGPPPMTGVVPFPFAPATEAPQPAPLSSFVGREQLLADVVALLHDPAARLVTLTGPGGIGKTRLAKTVAVAARAWFPDGVTFVPLETVRRAEDAMPAIAQALGLRERTGQPRALQLLDFLRGKRLLLVLDNFEQILDAGPQTSALLAAATGVTALVTSRAPLRVDGEREFPVPPLTQAGEQVAAMDLLASEAGRLFVERARAHDPAFVLDDASAADIADICARLDGLPLAIELAAARVKVLRPGQMRARLERRLPLLVHGARDASPRHRTMRDAIAWSYELLAPAEQRLFRRLAVFDGGFTLEAAERVGREADDGDEREVEVSTDVLDAVEHLIDQSLLDNAVGPSAAPRLRMLETIREFGQEQLAATGEDVDARARHARCFLSIARALRPWVCTHARLAPLDQLAAETANLQAALGWLDAHGPPAAFVELTAALAEYWLGLGLLYEGHHWLQRALGSIEHAASPDQARLLTGNAAILMGQGRFGEAEPMLERALTLSRAVGDPLDVAWTLILHGAVLNGGRNYRDAEASLHEAIALAGRIGDPALAAAVAGRALANLTSSARGAGDSARATGYSERAIRLYAGHGLDLAESISLMDLGASAREAGDIAIAATHWCAGLALTEERGDMRQVADALSGVAGVAATWGDHRPALLLYGAAEALRERSGAAMVWPFDIAASERGLAALRRAVGERRVADTLAEGRKLSLAEAVAIAAGITRPAAAESAATQGPDGLTRRESEVLSRLADQQTDREIAEALFLSRRTVQWHVRAVLAKLESGSRREAVDRARARGLL